MKILMIMKTLMAMVQENNLIYFIYLLPKNQKIPYQKTPATQPY
ncbi:hypothetical protein QF028_002625 [Neobacillus sp. B4I6]